jgi:hypothetical protein
LATTLFQVGQAGATIRICRPEDGEPLEPILHPFEPQPLNQANSALIEPPSDPTADAHQVPTDPSPNESSSRASALVRRNILLKGGWFLVGIFAVNAAIHGFLCIRDRELLPQFSIWTLALLVTLFLPVGANRRYQECLVVPSGIVLRKSGLFASRWTLRLFDRQNSVLLVFRQSKYQWGAVVADGTESNHIIATKAECEFLLRAWLSPQEPPPIERLSDFQ